MEYFSSLEVEGEWANQNSYQRGYRRSRGNTEDQNLDERKHENIILERKQRRLRKSSRLMKRKKNTNNQIKVWEKAPKSDKTNGTNTELTSLWRQQGGETKGMCLRSKRDYRNNTNEKWRKEHQRRWRRKDEPFICATTLCRKFKNKNGYIQISIHQIPKKTK